jgi:plastocyanin
MVLKNYLIPFLLLNGVLGGSIRAAPVEELDLEVMVEGERQLFPLLPGTKCPTGHQCRTRTSTGVTDMSPMLSILKHNLKSPLAATLDWGELDSNLENIVSSNNFCTRRAAMAKSAGLAAGLSAAAVAQPAYAAETKEVKMGTDSGGLQFVPAKTQICKGDSVKWINNKGGPHNVVFDEDAIPSGVDQEKISMDEQLGEEGDTFIMVFNTPGSYDYYCEPHRGAGMNGNLVVV